MYRITENIHWHMGPDPFQLITPFTLEGAEFDSFERDPPPRCHPGTRQDIMNAILAWRHNNNRTKRILWLNGPAGVGKSAIIQTLAEAEAEADQGLGRLGATLFISRSNKRADHNRVLGTIAYQLAVKDPAYRTYTASRLAGNPRLLEKNVPKQFEILISQPFGELLLCQGVGAWSVYIDGLDECIDEEAQCHLIELISAFTTQYPEAPLVWIIASRPESHLQDLFSREDISLTYHEVTIPVNSDAACQDVERYLRTELTKIKDRHPDLIPPTSLWPTETQFLEIARVASGLFVFATTVASYIGTIPDADSTPITQLHRVLAVIRHAKITFSPEENPLAPPDLLYHQVMSSIPPTTLHITKLTLGCAIYDAIYMSSLVVVANVLGLSQHTVYDALAKLSSVINIPKPEDAISSRVVVLHASFADYLKDQKRSGEYYVNVVEFHTTLWRCYFRILQQKIERNENYGTDLTWKHPKWGDPQTFYLIQHARMNWSRMLMATHDKFRMYSKMFQISVPVSEQLEVFDRILFHQLEGYVSGINTDDLVNLLLWIRYYPHEWHSQFQPYARKLGTMDEFVVKLRAEETKKVKAVVLGGWLAVVEEREPEEDGSVRIYILRLSEHV